MQQERSGRKMWSQRVGWFVLIWIASVASLTVVAVLLRLVMNMVGMTA